MHYYSIYTRLLAGISALLFVVLAVPFVYFSYTLETDMQKDAHDIAINSLNSVEWVLSQQKFSGLAELDAWTEAYAKVTGIWTAPNRRARGPKCCKPCARA